MNGRKQSLNRMFPTSLDFKSLQLPLFSISTSIGLQPRAQRSYQPTAHSRNLKLNGWQTNSFRSSENLPRTSKSKPSMLLISGTSQAHLLLNFLMHSSTRSTSSIFPLLTTTLASHLVQRFQLHFSGRLIWCQDTGHLTAILQFKKIFTQEKQNAEHIVLTRYFMSYQQALSRLYSKQAIK